jgi:hypothetical protein
MQNHNKYGCRGEREQCICKQFRIYLIECVFNASNNLQKYLLVKYIILYAWSYGSFCSKYFCT